MARITEEQIQDCRAQALLYIAFPQYRNGTPPPVYWDSQTARGVNPQGFIAHAFSPESLCRFFHGRIPDGVIGAVAAEMGCAPEDVMEFSAGDILTEAVGKPWFREPSAEYLRGSLRELRGRMHDYVDPAAVDRYAMQILEDGMHSRGKAKLVSLRVTASHKDSHAGMLDIPPEEGQFVGTIKLGLGGKGPLSRDMAQFVGHVLPPVWGNLNAYASRIDPTVAREWRKELTETGRCI